MYCVAISCMANEIVLGVEHSSCVNGSFCYPYFGTGKLKTVKCGGRFERFGILLMKI